MDLKIKFDLFNPLIKFMDLLNLTKRGQIHVIFNKFMNFKRSLSKGNFYLPNKSF